MFTLLRRVLRSMSSHFYLLPYKKMLLATFLLYVVVVRLDPGTALRFPFFCLNPAMVTEEKILAFNRSGGFGRHKNSEVETSYLCLFLIFLVAIHVAPQKPVFCKQLLHAQLFLTHEVQIERDGLSCCRLSLCSHHLEEPQGTYLLEE